MFLLYFDEEKKLAERLATAAQIASAPIRAHRFPDGEIKLQLPAQLPQHVVVLRSLHQPNDKLIELLLCAQGARQSGVRRLTLIAPYLAYMRQDKAFAPGEVVSQQVIGGFLASLFDGLITVDPHLHRISRLQDAVPLRQAWVLSAANLLAQLIARHHDNALLLGPDEEAEQWVAQAAAACGFEHAVCQKTRHGDRQVQIQLPALSFKGRAVVLIDDVASSGQTLIEATRLLCAAGARSVDVAVTHALFSGDAVQRLHEAGVHQIWSTDCITHPSNMVSMAEPLAQALGQLDA